MKKWTRPEDRVLSEEEVENWRVWIVNNGGREMPSIIASHEALRKRLESAEG